MGLKHLTGTSWHVGYIKSNDDTRRHKARCIYYLQGRCIRISAKCGGSAHCSHYSETEKHNIVNNPPTLMQSLQQSSKRPCHYSIAPKRIKCGFRKNQICNRHFCSKYIELGSKKFDNQKCFYNKGRKCNLPIHAICDFEKECPDFEKRNRR